jgi:hypothetical protein
MSIGCKIGKIRMKSGGAEVRVLPGREPRTFEGFFERAKEKSHGAVAVGYFVVYQDRTGFRDYTWGPGATLGDFVGGAEVLTEFIKRSEID